LASPRNQAQPPPPLCRFNPRLKFHRKLTQVWMMALDTPMLMMTVPCASDLRDFPALGSSALNATNPSLPANGSSYASQTGTASQVASGNVSTNGNGAASGFGPDDFPALGQPQAQDGHSVTSHGVGTTSGSSQELSTQHRQSLLGSLPTSQQRATPSSEAPQRVRSIVVLHRS